MKHVSLESVSTVYDCARLAKVEVHHVDDEDFHRFCLSLRKFERDLGEMASDDYWRQFLRLLKRYRFRMSSTPLPFNSTLDQSQSLVEHLEGLLTLSGQMYPLFANPARELVHLVSALSVSPSNPIQSVCTNIIGWGGPDVAILIKEPRLIPAVEQLLSNDHRVGSVEVVSPTQLTGHHCYSKLVVLGPARWYRDYVFQSPRALNIHIVKHRWLNDIKPSGGAFLGSSGNSGVNWVDRSRVVTAETKEGATSSSDGFDPDDFLSSVDWDDVLRRVSGRAVSESDHDDEDEEYVAAYLFELEDEIVIPLDAADSARATVLILNDEDGDLIQRIPVSNIEPGMFLLVRTGGGGEYIVVVADRLLRECAAKARLAQRDWKDHLRRKVRQDGIHQVVFDLERHGARRANHVNVNNWMSYRSIKTEDPKDFRAVMKLIGLADKFSDYWETMTLIDRAHRRAGQLIRKQLLAEVRNADLRDLEKLGRMDFELPGVEGGNLSAIRVQGVHPETVEISVTNLGHQFEMDGNQWLV